MINKVERYVTERNIIKKEDKLIVGVSGGADSICLLFVLLELQKRIPFELVVVHVNHGIRGEAAAADEIYVKQVCREHDITCVVYSENVELIAKNRKQSTEEAGRDVRREAFLRTMEEYGGTKIVLAHHKNDSAETFLMNLARGTGIKGLGGIRPVSGVFVRPLLCLEKWEIEQFLKEKNISYCVDSTNESDDYTRNRIRNHVIPYLEEAVNTRTISHICSVSEQLRELQQYLEEQTENYMKECVKEWEAGYIVLKTAFQSIPAIFQPFVLKRVLVQVGGREKDIEEIHLQELRNLFEKQVGKQMDLPYEMQGKRVYEGVQIRKKSLPERKCVRMEVSFREREQEEFRWRNSKIVCRLLENDAIGETYLEKYNTKRFDYDIITHEVCIRTRQPGDYITIHPDGRTQKLKSFFINEKIPQEKRDEVLLVADGHHILWVVGFRTNCAYQVGNYTKRILEIQVDEGERDGRDN